MNNKNQKSASTRRIISSFPPNKSVFAVFTDPRVERFVSSPVHAFAVIEKSTPEGTEYELDGFIDDGVLAKSLRDFLDFRYTPPEEEAA